MKSHSPGYWHTGSDEDAHIVYDENCNLVADAGRDDGDAELEQANAHVIAALPRLLERLSDLCDRAERARRILQDAKDGGWWGMLDTTSARAAIAEATTSEE